MSNRRHSSPRPAPDPVPLLPEVQLREQDWLFRHTFLARFDEDEESRALLVLGRMLAEYQNESGQWGDGMEGPTGQLRAVSAELNQIAAYLKMIGSDRGDRLLSAREDWLAGKAVEWSAELRKFASIIADEVTP